MMLKNWSMKNSSSSKKLLYLVTDVSTANVFGLVQLRYLWLKGYEIHLICGTGYLHSDLTKFCSSIIQVKQLSRNIYLVHDLISIFLLIRFFKRIKPSIAIYSTPKAALLGSVCARLTSTPIRIYQIWGARWQTLHGVKEKLVKAMDVITLTIAILQFNLGDITQAQDYVNLIEKIDPNTNNLNIIKEAIANSN